MTQEIISQIDSRIKAITDLEIRCIADDDKRNQLILNRTKIELLDLKIWICNLAQEKIREKLINA